MAKKKRKRIASRGSVNNIILKTLVNGDKYGYEIIKEVEEYSEGKIVLKQPSLYSSLSRFEEKGFVTSYWGDSDIGGRRHYYHLTEKGIDYYKREVLKEIDSEEDDEKKSDDKEIKNIIAEDFKYTLTEVPADSIPAIFNFEKKEEDIPNNVVDHHFYKQTPVDILQTEIKEENEENKEENITVESPTCQVVQVPWKTLANNVFLCNKRCANSPYRRLHYIRPKKAQKIILDKDGIFKLRDSDYIPTNKSKNEKIFDNVGKRKEPNHVYGYTSYSSIENEKNNAHHSELSEEERKKRNENFLNKFNLLTKSKMKNDNDDNDYQNKLDIFVDNTPVLTQTSQPENNLFNYIDEEEKETPKAPLFTSEKEVVEDEEDKFINFEPIEFETRNDDKQYIEEISSHPTPTDKIKMTRYETRSTAILSDKSYVLINKVKFLFGLILSLIMFSELTVALVLFKKFDLMKDGDSTLFIVAYIITGIIALSYILPILFNSNKHKLNNFKIKHSMLYGLLIFLISIILTYCFNTLVGFELEYINYFLPKLIIPILMTINFIILPPIYNLLINNKRFYN